MTRINKTENNLQMVWNQLDDACGLIENAFTNLGSMSGLPENIKKGVDQIDFSAIVGLKNEVEALIEQIKSR